MKSVSKFLSAVALAVGVGASALSLSAPATAADSNPRTIRAFYYSLNDLFVGQVSAALQDQATAQNIKLAQYDANDDLARQISQIQTVLSVHKDRMPIVVNPVDTQNGAAALRLAKQSKAPVIFFNRKPAQETLASYKDAWYVGSNAAHSGYYQAEIVKNYFEEHPEADRNKDGAISYVMFKGEPSHQDTMVRTTVFIRTLLDEKVKLKPIESVNANWSQMQAQNEMRNIIARRGLKDIEVIVANNDAMALGALLALQAEGYNIPNSTDKDKFIPVVGIDALPSALDAVERGTMIGTVLNDYNTVADVIVRISAAYLNGEVITEKLIGFPIKDHVIEVPYVQVTNKNIAHMSK